jgi:type IV secretory pathway VirB10-like protein
MSEYERPSEVTAEIPSETGPETAPEPSAARLAPQPEQAGNRGFFPSARVRALSRVAVTLGLCAFFLILGFVSIRYSRDQIEDASPLDLPVQGQVLSPEELERIAERARRLRELERQLEVLQEEPPAPPPAPAPPSAPVPVRSGVRGTTIFSIPMTGGGRGGSRSGSREGAALFDTPEGLFEESRKLVEALRPPAPGTASGLPGIGQALGGFPEGPSESAAVRPPLRESLRVEPEPPERYRLRQGSFLPVVLDHPINTDVPGLIRGHLARDVRDATGETLLLPQGTRLIGHQAAVIATGQARLMIDWHRLQLPDGHTVELTEPQGTAAIDGSLGATGKVDRHFGSRFGTALLLGALGATLQLSQPQQSSTFGQAASERQIAAGEVGARLNDLAERTLEERLNRPPTIEIPAGARLQLLLLQDLVFPGPVASVGTAGTGGSAPGDGASYSDFEAMGSRLLSGRPSLQLASGASYKARPEGLHRGAPGPDLSTIHAYAAFHPPSLDVQRPSEADAPIPPTAPLPVHQAGLGFPCRGRACLSGRAGGGASSEPPEREHQTGPNTNIGIGAQQPDQPGSLTTASIGIETT